MPAAFARQVRHYAYGFVQLMGLWVGYIPSQTIRNAIYRLMGLKMGKGSTIYSQAEIRGSHKIVIGENTIIGNRAILDGRGGLEIGSNVNLSTGVWIWTVDHNKDDPFFESRHHKVVIKDYAWISCRTVILPGVVIGEGAVVCAGAVVTKDVEPYTVAAGIPAKKIGERTHDLRYNLSGDIVPFI